MVGATGGSEGARRRGPEEGGADGARGRGPDGGGEEGARGGAGGGGVDGARRRGPNRGGERGPHRGANRGGVGRWGARRTGRVYTLSSINNIWNLTNTIELKHLKTVAHPDNKF
jgi:hypothetical protein